MYWCASGCCYCWVEPAAATADWSTQCGRFCCSRAAHFCQCNYVITRFCHMRQPPTTQRSHTVCQTSINSLLCIWLQLQFRYWLCRLLLWKPIVLSMTSWAMTSSCSNNVAQPPQYAMYVCNHNYTWTISIKLCNSSKYPLWLCLIALKFNNSFE